MSCYDMYKLNDTFASSMAYEFCVDPTIVPDPGVNNTIDNTTDTGGGGKPVIDGNGEVIDNGNKNNGSNN